MKTNIIRVFTLSLLSLWLGGASAQMPHIAYQLPDSVLNESGFDQLDTSSYLTTGVLWDRAAPHFDFLQYADNYL